MLIKLRTSILQSSEILPNEFPKYEFHIAKFLRQKYELNTDLFSITGNVLFVNNQAVRKFVKDINDKRIASAKIKVGEVNAAGLIDEIYHYLFRIYETQVNPGVIKKAADNLNRTVGEVNLRKLLFDFIAVFPPLDVYLGKISAFDYLNSFTADRTNVEITLEEMVLLFFANINPANKNILEFFDKEYLLEKELFSNAISHLEIFFKGEKKFGPENQDLFTFFKTPIINFPDSIEAQLEFIREKWGILLDEKFIAKLLGSKDLIKEDEAFGVFSGGGPAPTIAPIYKGLQEDASLFTLGKSGYNYAEDAWRDYEESENFTQDIDWMPKVVVLAKNIYVWLDQLSKKYGRFIKTLDQIPDEELEQLSRWGFNGLWLIGIWERSSASRKIKHIMGNIDAVASAYSLYDYEIARDIGGEGAYQNLNSRAKHFGIRLASDMVPNHTGIFSRWVMEHPHYFIQSDFPPFPNYRFTGPDLSDDNSVQLRIEDGYWSRSDAAVVFQRIDNRTGDVKYIYHGNDGTNMPWNDTAQLNMIKHEVREAVIQKIFEVARKFSIIRFDAAMTLAKKHFSRLWYPQPGKGGDIPSRADYSMTQNQFDELFPVEFWREVVDRINSEMPDTLLLAEAFWLMEGYFVRTLGMHRVYNSAFMHMMMKEENAKYRDLITNTLEFEPEILKRYVNFMSNPDEETAIKQFGTDDKYFGVCTMMVTLPGLPMFAHGQIEGFTEKYGMEYQRAYYHETPNEWLVERHARQIFPLIKKRFLFSDVQNFWLFDFIDGYGSINENVFAFTNYSRGERAIVFFNNKFEFTSGTISKSTSKLVSKNQQTKNLAEALNINTSPKHYYIFREHISNKEFIKKGSDFKNGFTVELNAFKYLIYWDFREVYDENGDYKKLFDRLNGNGVESIDLAMAELKLEPVHECFTDLFDDETLNGFVKSCMLNNEVAKCKDSRINFIDKKFKKLVNTIVKFFHLGFDMNTALKKFDDEIQTVKKFNDLLASLFPEENKFINKELNKRFLTNHFSNYHENSVILFLILVIKNISALFEKEGNKNIGDYYSKLMLDNPIKAVLNKLGKGDYEVFRAEQLISITIELSREIYELFDNTEFDDEKMDTAKNIGTLLKIIDNKIVWQYIGVNEFEGVIYYSKENLDEFFNWMFTVWAINYYTFLCSENQTKKNDPAAKMSHKIVRANNILSEFYLISSKSEYQLHKFIENLEELSI